MKLCRRCNQSYSDDSLNFCLNDGEILVQAAGQRPYDDSPPTVMMNDPRATNPASWQPPGAPPATWHPQNVMQYPTGVSPKQTLAVVSLCLGIASVTVGWCCYIGVLLSPAAMVTGFIALGQIKKDPARNAGRGFAIGGIVTAVVYLAVLILLIIIIGGVNLIKP